MGGQLLRSSMSKGFQHPIVLPKGHPFTGLIIYQYHFEMSHNSASFVLNSLRPHYHVIWQGRAIKYYIKQLCMGHRYRDAAFGSQLVAPLPPARDEIGQSAFENCGVDYMGPTRS